MLPCARRHASLAPVIALGLAAELVLTGCGASAWSPAQATLSGEALRQGGYASVDVLPLDLELWCDDDRDPAAIADGMSGVLQDALFLELARRGVERGARIGWDGRYRAADGLDHTALTPDQIEHTTYALASYDAAQAGAPRGALVAPFLPYRLGGATGADATLYVGGWAFAGHAPPSRGEQVGKVLLIAAAVVVVVVVIAALVGKSKGGGGGGHGGGGHGGGGHGGGGHGGGSYGGGHGGGGHGGPGSVVSGLGRALTGVGRAGGRVFGIAGRAAARATVRVTEAAMRATAEVLRSDTGLELVIETDGEEIELADGYGRPGGHIERAVGRPSYRDAPGAPRRGRSRIMLALTLIDNHTGRALWHAREVVEADPTRPGDVVRAVRHAFVSLPRRSRPTDARAIVAR